MGGLFARHRGGVEGFLELIFGDAEFVEPRFTNFADVASGAHGFFGDGGGFVIAEEGDERGDHGKGKLDQLVAAFGIRCDAGDASFSEG